MCFKHDAAVAKSIVSCVEKLLISPYIIPAEKESPAPNLSKTSISYFLEKKNSWLSNPMEDHAFLVALILSLRVK